MDEHNSQASPDQSTSNQKKHKFLPLIIAFLLLVIGWFGGHFVTSQKIDLPGSFHPSPSIIPEVTRVDDVPTESREYWTDQLAFVAPNNWKITYWDGALLFESPGIKRDEGLGEIIEGASIHLRRLEKDKNKTLSEQVISDRPTEVLETDLKPFVIGDNTGVSLYYCWEICSNEYYLEAPDAIWEIAFICKPQCSTAAAEQNVYAAARDVFLQSLEIK